jgi:hypothetical protein
MVTIENPFGVRTVIEPTTEHNAASVTFTENNPEPILWKVCEELKDTLI